MFCISGVLSPLRPVTQPGSSRITELCVVSFSQSSLIVFYVLCVAQVGSFPSLGLNLIFDKNEKVQWFLTKGSTTPGGGFENEGGMHVIFGFYTNQSPADIWCPGSKNDNPSAIQRSASHKVQLFHSTHQQHLYRETLNDLQGFANFTSLLATVRKTIFWGKRWLLITLIGNQLVFADRLGLVQRIAGKLKTRPHHWEEKAKPMTRGALELQDKA